jgi:hypothetical protein
MHNVRKDSHKECPQAHIERIAWDDIVGALNAKPRKKMRS